jgi:hypothetical protein
MSDSQIRRARQYAVCTYALGYDRVTDGAEGIFDQALTNGLAAIVAHSWPGAEHDGRRMLSASKLLDVIEHHGKRTGAGVVRVLHDPEGTEWISLPFADEPAPNFTAVHVETLRDALEATQAIRHARISDEEPARAILREHVDALGELDHHPALFALSDEMIDRAEITAEKLDARERARAAAYYHTLGDDERERRRDLDFLSLYDRQGHAPRREIELCPVCGTFALICEEFESLLDAIGIGTCVVCSYARSRDVADQLARDEHVRRMMEGDD